MYAEGFAFGGSFNEHQFGFEGKATGVAAVLSLNFEAIAEDGCEVGNIEVIGVLPRPRKVSACGSVGGDAAGNFVEVVTTVEHDGTGYKIETIIPRAAVLGTGCALVFSEGEKEINATVCFGGIGWEEGFSVEGAVVGEGIVEVNGDTGGIAGGGLESVEEAGEG